MAAGPRIEMEGGQAMSTATLKRAQAGERTTRRAGAETTHTVNLALQGGGAHGAFTWGVLDRLLDDERSDFEGISATNAGAMNACVFAYGMTLGGREGAKCALANFWRRISHAAAFSPLQPTPIEKLMGMRTLEFSPAFLYFDLLTRLLSPYQFNPLNLNPLRQVLLQTVDFESLRRSTCKVKLFLSATNVRTGKIKVFENDEIGPDAVLASGCLPFIFQAVEIEGEAYWDGGYMGNPAMFPLIYGCDSRDVIVVHVNPIMRPELPHSAAEILNRINEISFNSSLMREMRAISFVTRLIEDGEANEMHLKRMLVHGIANEQAMSGLSVASKLNADWEFLTFLKEIGRTAADDWLAANFGQLGKKSTIDLQTTYL